MNRTVQRYLFDRLNKRLLNDDYVLFWDNLTSFEILSGEGFSIGKILSYNIHNRTMTILRLFDEEIFYDVHELNVIKI